MDKSIILIRTSSKEQNPYLQLEECKEYNKKKNWDCVSIFEKKESAFKNEEGVWKEEIDFAIKNKVKHIIVWNMDRFSRLPEERVLREVKVLSLIHSLQIHAVHGDYWSEMVESIGKLKELGFIGDAIAEFLEKLLRGLEFQRAHRESLTKSERTKLAIVRKDGEKTKSYKGNLWGVHSLPKNIDEQIIKLLKEGKKYRQISKEVYYWDKSRNKKFVSIGYVHKIADKLKKENSS